MRPCEACDSALLSLEVDVGSEKPNPTNVTFRLNGAGIHDPFMRWASDVTLFGRFV